MAYLNKKKSPKGSLHHSSESNQGYYPIREMLIMALLVALSLALAALESLLPPLLPLPGIKLGLANIITLMALAMLSLRKVFLVVVLRLLLASFVLGKFLTPTFWISLAGGLLSYIFMAAFSQVKSLSLMGLGLLGAVGHHLGQLLAVYILMKNSAIFYYLPWLLLGAVPVGLFTGFSAKSAIRALSKAGLNDTM